MIYSLIICELFLLIVSYYLFGRDLASPSVLVNLSFFVSGISLIPYINRWNLNINIRTLLIIISGNIVFMVGEFIISLRRQNGRLICYSDFTCEDDNSLIFSIPKTFTWIILIILILSIAIIYRYMASNVVLETTSSGNRMTMLMSYRYDSDRYSRSWIVALNTFGNIVSYPYLFYVVYSIVVKRNHKIALEIFTTIASVLLNAMSSARINVIFLIGSLWVWICYLLRYKNNRSRIRKINKKLILIGIFLAALLIAVFSLLGTMTGKTGNSFNEQAEMLSGYFGGGMIGLDKYLSNIQSYGFIKSNETLYGINSIITKLGYDAICKYRNLQFFYMGSSKYTSNVYTVYRRLIHDYGISGMYIIRFIEGIFYGICKRRLYESKTNHTLFKRLLILGTISGLLITEAVDCYFIMIIPTISEIILLILETVTYNNFSSDKHNKNRTRIKFTFNK